MKGGDAFLIGFMFFVLAILISVLGDIAERQKRRLVVMERRINELEQAVKEMGGEG